MMNTTNKISEVLARNGLYELDITLVQDVADDSHGGTRRRAVLETVARLLDEADAVESSERVSGVDTGTAHKVRNDARAILAEVLR